LVGDLDPGLAGQAVDLLARQPRARPALLQLARWPLSVPDREKLNVARQNTLIGRYEPTPLHRPVPALLVQCSGVRNDEDLEAAADHWIALLRDGVTRRVVPGRHVGPDSFLVEPHVGVVAGHGLERQRLRKRRVEFSGGVEADLELRRDELREQRREREEETNSSDQSARCGRFSRFFQPKRTFLDCGWGPRRRRRGRRDF
jgi:hypothetical protein